MNGNYLFWNVPTFFLLISFKIITFLLLLSSNIGKVAELWTLVYGNATKERGMVCNADSGGPLIVKENGRLVIE